MALLPHTDFKEALNSLNIYMYPPIFSRAQDHKTAVSERDTIALSWHSSKTSFTPFPQTFCSNNNNKQKDLFAAVQGKVMSVLSIINIWESGV